MRRAFGRFAGALTRCCTGPGRHWLGGSVTVVAIAVYQRFVGDLTLPAMYLFGGLLIAAATAYAIIPLRAAKWVPVSGAIGQIVLLASSPPASSCTAPSTACTASQPRTSARPGRCSSQWCRCCCTFVGVELPATAGEEMINPRRDIPAAIGRAGIGQALMYGIPILAVLIVLPPGRSPRCTA